MEPAPVLAFNSFQLQAKPVRRPAGGTPSTLLWAGPPARMPALRFSTASILLRAGSLELKAVVLEGAAAATAEAAAAETATATEAASTEAGAA